MVSFYFWTSLQTWLSGRTKRACAVGGRLSQVSAAVASLSPSTLAACEGQAGHLEESSGAGGCAGRQAE